MAASALATVQHTLAIAGMETAVAGAPSADSSCKTEPCRLPAIAQATDSQCTNLFDMYDLSMATAAQGFWNVAQQHSANSSNSTWDAAMGISQASSVCIAHSWHQQLAKWLHVTILGSVGR